LPSILGSSDCAVVAASLMVNTTDHPGGAADEPLKTIATGGHHHVVAANLMKFHGDHAGCEDGAERNQPATEPLKTQDVSNRFAVVSAHMVQKGHIHSNSQMVKGVDEPMRTQATRAEHAVVAANMVRLNGDPATHAPGSPADDPLGALAAGGQHHGLVAAKLVSGSSPSPRPSPQGEGEAAAAYLAQHNGGFNSNPGHVADEPISTIGATGSQQQIVLAKLGATTAYFGSEADGQALDESLRTISTKPRFGLTEAEARAPLMREEHVAGALRVAKFLRAHGVQVDGEYAMVGGLVIVDLAMRMLTPRELFRAQGFPESYIIEQAMVFNPESQEVETVKLTKEQQIRMCGNSVSPPVAEALIRANNPELCTWLNQDVADFRQMERMAKREHAMA
jgi:DNA (cytosine-5)-methyltransferase 1